MNSARWKVPHPRGDGTATVTSAADQPGRAGLDGAHRKLWRVLRRTVVELFHYRTTGLAAEAAFFALLSLPPLVLGLIGLFGYVRSMVGASMVSQTRSWILANAHVVLTDSTVEQVVRPIVDSVLSGAGVDVISLSFIVSLWAGSRAVNVYVDTITISYGLAGVRSIIKTRVLAFLLYLAGLAGGLVLIPLLVAGPLVVRAVLPEAAGVVNILYWPTVCVLSILLLTTLYHVSIPVRTPWRRDLPGAALAMMIWILGSFLLRLFLDASLSGISIYGTLAAPIAVLAWLYVTALAVLIGAALNAEIDRVWPTPATADARARMPEPPARNQLEMRSGQQ